LRIMEVWPTNLPDYLKGIKDTYVLRKIKDTAIDIASVAMHAQEPGEVVSKLIDAANDAIVDSTTEGATLSIGSLVESEYMAFCERLKNPGYGTHIPIGIMEFDLLLGGVSPSDLIYIAGKTSMGKTSLLLTVLYNIAKRGIPVALFSYEMTKEQIFKRLVAIESGVEYRLIDQGRVEAHNVAKVEGAYMVVGSVPFFLNYHASMNVDEILNETTKLVTYHGVQIAAIDYIQLMPCGSDSRNIELGNISRKLKVHAVKNGLVWLAASQLNRYIDHRDDKLPRLSDLKDSGNLEQDADMVIMLHRNESVEDEVETHILIRKNRNGPTLNLKAVYDLPSMSFLDRGQTVGW